MIYKIGDMIRVNKHYKSNRFNIGDILKIRTVLEPEGMIGQNHFFAQDKNGASWWIAESGVESCLFYILKNL